MPPMIVAKDMGMSRGRRGIPILLAQAWTTGRKVSTTGVLLITQLTRATEGRNRMRAAVGVLGRP